MATEPENPTARAHKIASSILKATSRSQTAVAAAMGVSESTVSRLLTDHLEKLSLVMAHAGLRVVSEDMRCFKPEYVDALLVMAKQHITTLQTVAHLEWD